MTALFVTVTGQEDNLGDSLLRRGYLESVRAIGALHVLTGANSASYVTGLGLRDGDRSYSTRSLWERHLVREALLGRRPLLLLNAGEARISDGHEYVGRRLDLLARLVAACGGSVVQTGLGVREGSSAHPSPRLRAFLRRAALVTWRDAESAAAVGVGSVAPDWAFALDELETPESSASRRFLAISMRGDRAVPDQSWLDTVRALAVEHDLTLLIVTQVQRDNARAHEIAELLGDAVEVRAWESGTHADRLAALEDVYASCRLIVSDRLHALVLAASRGAVPLGLTTASAEKLRRTLAPARLDEWSFDADAGSAVLGMPLPEAAEIIDRHRSAGTALRRTVSTLAELTEK